jgi:hypothetical protein
MLISVLHPKYFKPYQLLIGVDSKEDLMALKVLIHILEEGLESNVSHMKEIEKERGMSDVSARLYRGVDVRTLKDIISRLSVMVDVNE